MIRYRHSNGTEVVGHDLGNHHLAVAAPGGSPLPDVGLVDVIALDPDEWTLVPDPVPTVATYRLVDPRGVGSSPFTAPGLPDDPTKGDVITVDSVDYVVFGVTRAGGRHRVTVQATIRRVSP